MDYQILLYYKYISLEEPEKLVETQRSLCQELDLKGRIIIGREGINGTVEGTRENTESYIARMSQDPRFQDIHWKKSKGTGEAFPKLSVKYRAEIVSGHLGEHDINPRQTTGSYITPQELHQWFLEKKEFYIVDMRNDYEHAVGHFEGSILPPFANFRDLPTVLSVIDHLKHKTILTVCTGGVRCEKASGFLVKNGFSNVYQLQGGIVSYMERYPNQHFLGKLYVFDGRIVMGFGNDADPNHVIVGRCRLCGKPSERYVNCQNLSCHLHFICCTDCIEKGKPAFCSNECRTKTLTAVT